MADLQRLREFAQTHNFDLTRPLRHDQVALLATNWRPRMKFHYDEKFFPVSLDDMITMVETHLASLSPVRQNELKVTKLLRDGSSFAFATFDPPVVHVPDGFVNVAGQLRPAVRVLTEPGMTPRAALAMPEIDTGAVITHGATAGRASEFFGPETTVNGLGVAAPGEPYLPRAEEPDPANPGQTRPRITVMAALLNLLELLKYELQVAGDGNYPPDGLRRGFDIGGSLIRPMGPNPPLVTAEAIRQFLLAQIAWHESGGSGAPPSPPSGWRLDRLAWDAVTRYAFLEYSFFYAYNDFDRYQTAIFENEHEGDDEGCCLVFDRNQINLAAGSPDPSLLLRIVPLAIITSVHEEYQNADLIQFIPVPVQQPGEEPRPARQIFDPNVYVAGGSHATYLTAGTHDLVDYGDYWGYVGNGLLVIIFAPVILVITIILAILEHFIDTEDFTSEDGIHGGPDTPGGARVSQVLIVLPMSSDTHIYDGRPENEDLLLLRSYAGKWGGHNGLVDHSPPFAPKTGRYFRKLLDGLS